VCVCVYVPNALMLICWAVSTLDVKYLVDVETVPHHVWHDLVKDVTKNASHDQKRED